MMLQTSGSAQMVCTYYSCLCIPSIDQENNNNKKHFGVRAFSNAAPNLWNSLPTSLTGHNPKKAFKKILKKYLLSGN